MGSSYIFFGIWEQGIQFKKCLKMSQLPGFEPRCKTNCTKVSEICYSTKLLFFYLDLSLDANSFGQDKIV